MTDDLALIAQVRGALEKATPGEWRVDERHPVTGYADVDAVIVADSQPIASMFGGHDLQPDRGLPTLETCLGNAALIALAKNALPRLLELAKAGVRSEMVTEAARNFVSVCHDYELQDGSHWDTGLGDDFHVRLTALQNVLNEEKHD